MNPLVETDAQKDLYWKRFDRLRWGFLGWGIQRMQSALSKQARPVTQALNESISAGLGALETISTKPIEDAFSDLYGRVGASFAMEVYGSFKAHVSTMQTKQVEESMFMEFIRQWVQIAGASRVQSITETTRKKLRIFLETAIEEGLGTEEAARILARNQSIIGLTRARVISRTEIISASNRGSIEGARRTNLNLEKEWISTRDGRTRRISDEDRFDHFVIDGQTVGLEAPFTVPGRFGPEQILFPGDPKGSPGNTVMCRCTQGYRTI